MARSDRVEQLEGVLVMSILGAGFLAMFAGFDWFFVVWIIGFAVFLPIVAILLEDEEDEKSLSEAIDSTFATIGTAIRDAERGYHDHVEPALEGRESRPRDADRRDAESTVDALAVLRERYARGELTDEQFDRKLDRLMETTTPENAAEWRDAERERERERELEG